MQLGQRVQADPIKTNAEVNSWGDTFRLRLDNAGARLREAISGGPYNKGSRNPRIGRRDRFGKVISERTRELIASPARKAKSSPSRRGPKRRSHQPATRRRSWRQARRANSVEKVMSGVGTNFLRAAGVLGALGRGGPPRLSKFIQRPSHIL